VARTAVRKAGLAGVGLLLVASMGGGFLTLPLLEPLHVWAPRRSGLVGRVLWSPAACDRRSDGDVGSGVHHRRGGRASDLALPHAGGGGRRRRNGSPVGRVDRIRSPLMPGWDAGHHTNALADCAMTPDLATLRRTAEAAGLRCVVAGVIADEARRALVLRRLPSGPLSHRACGTSPAVMSRPGSHWSRHFAGRSSRRLAGRSWVSRP
jgi:hypothetical protein